MLLTSGLAFAQKAKPKSAKKAAVVKPVSCNFVYEVDSTLKEKDYLLSSYLTDGECDVYHATRMRENFAEILKTKIPISKAYFSERFKDICIIDKCVLEKVGVYRMSVPGEVMVIITYNPKKQ